MIELSWGKTMSKIQKQEHWLSLTRSHQDCWKNQKISKTHREAINKLGEKLNNLNPNSSYDEIYQIIKWINDEFPIKRLGISQKNLLKYVVQGLGRMLKNLE
jgi:hypothetical protein